MEEKQTQTQVETLITSPTHNRKTINGRLPLDSLIQIWARLPLKSLYRFRSVCKLWNSTISSDPLLSSLCHSLNPNPNKPFSSSPPNLLLFLLHTPGEPIKHPDHPLHFSTRPIEHVISTFSEPALTRVRNGFTPYVDHSLDLLPSKGPLVCLASGGYFYLCNPSTQEFLRVSRGKECSFTSSSAGFGYIEDENRYILVRFLEGQCGFLEFGPGYAGYASWRVVEPECPVEIKGFGIMVHGSFYWRVEEDGGENGSAFVVCLDTKEERFGVVGRPEGNENEVILYQNLYLVEFKESVCAVDNFSRPPRMEIWVLMRNGWEFNWVRKYNIFISGMGRDLVYPFFNYEGENGGEMMLCNGTRSRLYCCNLKSRSIKQVYKPKNRTSDRLALYTPGLFPLSWKDE